MYSTRLTRAEPATDTRQASMQGSGASAGTSAVTDPVPQAAAGARSPAVTATLPGYVPVIHTVPQAQYTYPREALYARSAADSYGPVAVDSYGRQYVRPVSVHGMPVAYHVPVDGVDAAVAQHQPMLVAQNPAYAYQGWRLPEQPASDRVLIQATCDNEHFAVVNVTGLDSAPAIRKRILEKLGLPVDTSNVALYRTEIGEPDTPRSPAVDDDMLLALCLQFGDNKGTMKFRVVPGQRARATSTHGQELHMRTRSAPQATPPSSAFDDRQRWRQPYVATRDDPYMTAMFPATSNRMVSQFQLISPATTGSSLQPGMTVQELLSKGPGHHGASAGASSIPARSSMPASSSASTEAPPEYARTVDSTPLTATGTSPAQSSGSSAQRLSSASPGVATAFPLSEMTRVTSTPSPVPRALLPSPARRASPSQRASPVPANAQSPAQCIHSAMSDGAAYPLFKSHSEPAPASPADTLSQPPRDAPTASQSPPVAPMSAPVAAPSEPLERLMQQVSVSQDQGAFPSFGTFGDDEMGGTFAQPLDSGTVMPEGTLRADDGTLSAHASGVRPASANTHAQSNWAVRPSAEQLYERIDDYFPRHDLDRPLVEGSSVGDAAAAATAVAANETQAESDRRVLRTIPPSLTRGQNHSIRVIAQNRKRMLDRSNRDARRKNTKSKDAPNNAQTTKLDRRKSTKLWGGHVVEMTANETPAMPSSSDSKPVFKWVKGDLIGKGTYGRVYLALNATTGEMIAVKQVELPHTAADRESARQRSVIGALKSEIETLKDLDHVNIVTCLGFEETPQNMSIFLEYVPGGSIGSCLRKHGKFEEDTVSSFLNQILQALAYLHKQGILHRDLKADNILVDYHGTCKISDFGTVRRSADIYNNVENMSLQGSIFWMAPEVMSLSRKGYSAKVDIWSLGCVVLEMLAGRRPWSDEEAVQAMFKIGAERRAPPVPSDCHLSKPAAHFLRNCFEIDPERRPTATRLLEHVFAWPPPDWCFEQSALWRALAN